MRWKHRYTRGGFSWFQEGPGAGATDLLEAVTFGMAYGSGPWTVLMSPRNYKDLRLAHPTLELPEDGGRIRFSFGEGIIVPLVGFAGLAVVSALR